MRYHEYVLHKLKEEREMQLEMELLPHTRCDYCDELVFSEDAVVRTLHVSTHASRQLHFCSDNCSQQHYLSELRRYEL